MMTQNKLKGNMKSPNKEKKDMISLYKAENNNKIIQKKNEIKLKLKIEKKDVNKSIFFIDNFIQGEHRHDNLKELNQLNTQIFINNIKYKYEKSFRPQKDGFHEIKINFNIKIKDCSYMFYDCSNLSNLDLSSFDTSNVNNMSHMFDKCYNLTNLDLSSFDTKNVTNMSYMFSVCSNLANVNLSSFDTKNTTDMSGMFYYCSNLTNIDISSFDTQKVTNINNIFSWCSKLNLIKINNNSYNIIKELKNNNNNNITIVDQSGKPISYINKSHRDFKNIYNLSSTNNNLNNNSNNNLNNNFNSQLNNDSDDSIINSIKNWWNNL